MGKMFEQFFSFLTNLFSAADNAAQALNNGAVWANEASGEFADKKRLERNAATRAMMIEAGITTFPKRGEKATVTQEEIAAAKQAKDK